jgi:MarR family transcriptional regulator, organic hydroperoxide resistance regulator
VRPVVRRPSPSGQRNSQHEQPAAPARHSRHEVERSYFHLVLSDFVEHQHSGPRPERVIPHRTSPHGTLPHRTPPHGTLLALQRATHATLQVLSRELARLELNGSEINVLAVLADGHPRSTGELAAQTATRPTTLTSVLDRLVRKGHVVRELDPADRRSFTVGLTDGGRRAAAAVDAAVRQLEESALAGLGPAELTGFHSVLQALTEVAP